jgi:hypothetical protein
MLKHIQQFLLIQVLTKVASIQQHTLKNVSNYWNTKIYSYLETFGGKSSNLYLNVVHFFSTPVLIRHLRQLKAVVFLHWCLILAILLVLLKKT